METILNSADEALIGSFLSADWGSVICPWAKNPSSHAVRPAFLRRIHNIDDDTMSSVPQSWNAESSPIVRVHMLRVLRKGFCSAATEDWIARVSRVWKSRNDDEEGRTTVASFTDLEQDIHSAD